MLCLYLFFKLKQKLNKQPATVAKSTCQVEITKIGSISKGFVIYKAILLHTKYLKIEPPRHQWQGEVLILSVFSISLTQTLLKIKWWQEKTALDKFSNVSFLYYPAESAQREKDDGGDEPLGETL